MSTSAEYWRKYVYWRDKRTKHHNRVRELDGIYNSYTSWGGITGCDDKVNDRLKWVSRRVGEGIKGVYTGNESTIQGAKECDAMSDGNVAGSRADISAERSREIGERDRAYEWREYFYRKYWEAKLEGK